MPHRAEDAPLPAYLRDLAIKALDCVITTPTWLAGAWDEAPRDASGAEPSPACTTSSTHRHKKRFSITNWLFADEGVVEACRFPRSVRTVFHVRAHSYARDETCRGRSYAPSLPSRREWIMLRRIRNASDCSVSVMPASILTSTDRTATVAFSRLRRP